MSEQVRVYDSEPYQTELTARITACLPDGEGMLVLTDRTCFFPGGGGQDPDTGRIGGCTVAGVFEKDGLIWLKTAGVFREGEEVVLSVDPSKRRDDVEVHSGEHISANVDKRIAGLERLNLKNADYLEAHPDAAWIRGMKLVPLYRAKGESKKALCVWRGCARKKPFNILGNIKYLVKALAAR